MKIYTLLEIRKMMNIDSWEDEDLYSMYAEIDCSTLLLIDEEPGWRLTLDNWVEYKSGHYINDELWLDTSSLPIIQTLMDRYSKGLEVYPILVDKDFQIVDGSHRLAALNTLGITMTKILYPIGN